MTQHTTLNEAQKHLVFQLESYSPWDEREEEYRQIILGQVRATPLWWHRETLPGHVTASGFVVDPSLEFMLLHHHRKLDRWLQLGGHDEGEQDPAAAVLREVGEESGLLSYGFLDGPRIFDLDVHEIPTTPKIEAHAHLDCRYLLVAERDEALTMQEAESNAIGWFPLQEAARMMGEVGAERVLQKVLQLRVN